MATAPPNAPSLCVVNEKVVTAVVILVVNLSAASIAMLTDRTNPATKAKAEPPEPDRTVPVPHRMLITPADTALAPVVS